MAPAKAKKSVTKSELLLKIDHIKYRTSSAGRSPIGALYIYSDHIEWKEPSETETLNIPFSNVKLQRVSAPDKPKIQLQIVMYDDNQATFVFMKPQSDSSTLLEDRNLVRDTLQEALIRHRKITHQTASTSDKQLQSETDQKIKILNENPYLANLYRHLVAAKLISPQDFWSKHYKSDDSSVNDVGVSGGFLGSIVQSDGVNGVRLNLNTDTIQAIFRTYPTVEKKHLELVPHEMTEQEFWTKFFQSHYFHRERASELNPNDPFSDCVRMDEKDMNAILQTSHVKKNLDFGYLREDLGLISEIRANNIPIKENELKSLLVKRCNYHSKRVLSTIRETSHPNESNETLKLNGDLPSTSQMNGNMEIELESEELRSFKDTIAEDFCILNMKEAYSSAPEKTYAPEEARRLASLAKELTQAPQKSLGLINAMPADYNDVEMESDEINIFEGMHPNTVRELHAIHGCVFELLKHFWACFPPITPELEAKLVKMNETICLYESNQLVDATNTFGRKNVGLDSNSSYMIQILCGTLLPNDT